MRTTFVGTALNGSAIFDEDGLRDNGSVDQEVVCILEHESICSEDLSFFDRNGRIGMNLQVCANVTAAQCDYIVSVTLNKEASEVKAEGIMRNDEHPHDLPGFKLLEDDMTVFLPSVRKTIPFTGIFRDDGYNPSFFRTSSRQISPLSAKQHKSEQFSDILFNP